MKRIFVFCAFVALCIPAFGQTQTGKVRTAGTPTSNGEPISGVTVKMNGNYNSVLSDQQGVFEVHMAGLRNGDPISIERVFKLGYVLLDDNYLATEKPFSTKVPLEIVMKSKALIEREQREIEETAYANANARYERRLHQLDSALRESLISAEDMQRELEKLQEQYQTYESLIGTLSKHYSMMDYDTMSDIDIEINSSIRNGDLLRADSLLNSKGNLAQRLSDYQAEMHSVTKAEAELEMAKKRLNVRKRTLTKAKESLSSDLFNKYTICMGSFNLDSAEYYILARASLDTTNVDWQLDACDFLENYSGKYQQAYDIYMRTLRVAEQNQNNPDAIGNIYNAIGILLNSLGLYSDAMDMIQKAKISYELNPDPVHPNKAAVRNNIAGTYGYMGQIDSMLVYAEEALLINQACFGENSRECAVNMNMIAEAYRMKGNLQAALEMHKKALDIIKVNDGEQSLYVALSYNNIAGIFAEMGDYALAIDVCNSAWNIISQITDEGSGHRCTVASNLAVYNKYAGNLQEALNWVDCAISTLECGNSNKSALQTCYKFKGEVLTALGKYNEAIAAFDMGLACWNSPTAELTLTIAKASIYEGFGYLLEALECYKTLLNKYEQDKPSGIELPEDVRRDLDGYINLIYIQILQNRHYESDVLSGVKEEYNAFLEDKIYLYVVSTDGPSAAAGLSGVNYLLRMNEWETDSLVDIFAYSSTLSGKEKNVVLFTPDGIKAVRFDDKMGARIYMDRIPKEWKIQMLNEYRIWLQQK